MEEGDQKAEGHQKVEALREEEGRRQGMPGPRIVAPHALGE
jgi:hypothetical protein